MNYNVSVNGVGLSDFTKAAWTHADGNAVKDLKEKGYVTKQNSISLIKKDVSLQSFSNDNLALFAVYKGKILADLFDKNGNNDKKLQFNELGLYGKKLQEKGIKLDKNGNGIIEDGEETNNFYSALLASCANIDKKDNTVYFTTLLHPLNMLDDPGNDEDSSRGSYGILGENPEATQILFKEAKKLINNVPKNYYSEEDVNEIPSPSLARYENGLQLANLAFTKAEALKKTLDKNGDGKLQVEEFRNSDDYKEVIEKLDKLNIDLDVGAYDAEDGIVDPKILDAAILASSSFVYKEEFSTLETVKDFNNAVKYNRDKTDYNKAFTGPAMYDDDVSYGFLGKDNRISGFLFNNAMDIVNKSNIGSSNCK